MSDPIDIEKSCSRCGQRRPLQQFDRRTAAKDGHFGVCKLCRRAERVAEYAQNPEARAQQNRNSYYRHREKRIADAGAWKAANPDKVKAYRRTHYECNREHALELCRQWQAANPDRVTAMWRRRRARKLSATIGEIDLHALWESQLGLCPLCDTPINPELAWPHPLSKSVDHITPLSLGGSHEQPNLQWTHLRCNQQKGSRPNH